MFLRHLDDSRSCRNKPKCTLRMQRLDEKGHFALALCDRSFCLLLSTKSTQFGLPASHCTPFSSTLSFSKGFAPRSRHNRVRQIRHISSACLCCGCPVPSCPQLRRGSVDLPCPPQTTTRQAAYYLSPAAFAQPAVPRLRLEHRVNDDPPDSTTTAFFPPESPATCGCFGSHDPTRDQCCSLLGEGRNTRHR